MRTTKIVSLIMVAVLICFAAVPVFAEDPLFTTTALYDTLTANAATKSLDLVEEAKASSAKAGETVEISVAAEQGIPGLYAIEFTVGFDNTKFQYAGFEKAEIITADKINVGSKVNANNVIVRINAYNTGADLYTAEKTVLVTVKLKALVDMDKFDGAVTLTAGKSATRENVEVETTAKSYISVVYGDVNADGNVDIFDLIKLQKYVSDNTVVINAANADVNANGEVELMDLIRLKKYVAGVAGTVLGPNA